MRRRAFTALAAAALALPLGGCGLVLGIEELSSDGGGDPTAPGWSRRFGAGGVQAADDIALLGGGVVVSGTHEGALDLGGEAISADSEVFLASFDAGGAHRFSAGLPNLDGGAPPTLRIAASGDELVVAGGFSGKISVGQSALLTSAGGSDVFVARLDAAGRGLQARQFGGAGDQLALDVAAAEGVVALAGAFDQSVNLGNGARTSVGGDDLFAAALDAAGLSVTWDQPHGGSGDDLALRVAVGTGGELILAGSSTGSFPFGAAQAEAGALFVARLDPGGGAAWIRSFGQDSDHLAGVAVDPDGNVLLAGHFSGDLDLGQALQSAGSEDVFLVQLDPGGDHVWSQRLGGPDSQRCFGLHVDTAGQVTIAGALSGRADFRGGVLESAGGDDAFVARFSAAGEHLWSAVYGDAGDQVAQAVAADAAGDIYLAGQLGGEIDFGHGVLRATGDADLFVTKVSPAAP